MMVFGFIWANVFHITANKVDHMFCE